MSNIYAGISLKELGITKHELQAIRNDIIKVLEKHSDKNYHIIELKLMPFRK